jgi:hypothetical protein
MYLILSEVILSIKLFKLVRNESGASVDIFVLLVKIDLLIHKGFFAKIFSKKSAHFEIYVKHYFVIFLNLMPLLAERASPYHIKEKGSSLRASTLELPTCVI